MTVGVIGCIKRPPVDDVTADSRVLGDGGIVFAIKSVDRSTASLGRVRQATSSGAIANLGKRVLV